MSLTIQKRWSVCSITDTEEFVHFCTSFDRLCQTNNKPNLALPVLRLLFQRGIDTIDKAQYFFKPSLTHLHSPFLMKDMEKAVQRIIKAIENNEKILIYGDYDVDGTTAVSMVYSFFKKYHSSIEYYIPDRYKEGYGVSQAGIAYAIVHGFSLIITLDCGIKSSDRVLEAQESGIDFIICDHHLPSEDIPKALAILDPKQTNCNYPYKELSGCGVGFKLLQAFALRKGINASEVEKYLDLVAISIAADIVPLTGENRVLAHFGLRKINSSPNIGIKAMMDTQRKTDNYSISDIVFLLAPRINAAGRMDDACHSVKLMTAEDENIAVLQNKVIELKNTERKGYDSRITEEALVLLHKDPLIDSKKTTVVFHPEWHKGVVGIVASRLTEHYYRPTVVLTESKGLLTGSARSVAGYDLHWALEQCKQHLEQFGGHKFAAGLTLKLENLDIFKQSFENIVGQTISDEMLIPEIVIDAEIAIADINPKLYQLLKLLAPFGPGNMTPIFMTKELCLTKHEAIVLGNEHLKFKLIHPDGGVLDCIGFGLAEYADMLNAKQKFDICYQIQENVWQNQRSLQLNLKSLRLC